MVNSPDAAALDGAVLVQTRRDKEDRRPEIVARNRCCLVVDVFAERQWDAEVLQLRAGKMVQVRTRDVPFRTQIRIPCVEDTVEQNAVGRLRQDVRHFSDCRSALIRCRGVDGRHLTWLLGASNKLHMQYEF